MGVLIGHGTGNPNSHQAALAYWEKRKLDCFYVSWLLSPTELELLAKLPFVKSYVKRFDRRSFPPLLQAPLKQDRWREALRMVKRTLLKPDAAEAELAELKFQEQFDLRLAKECLTSKATAVHAYEATAMYTFKAARSLGKVCIYDLPAWYYPARVLIDRKLTAKFSDWLPISWKSLELDDSYRLKLQEVESADLVLAASTNVIQSVQEYLPQKELFLTPYGVDLEFWFPAVRVTDTPNIHFVYAGGISVRKGVPVLLEAWEKAGLTNATLTLAGTWMLAEQKRETLPSNVRYIGPCSSKQLRELYWQSDVFVFPSFADGFGLVLLESLACGIPVIASRASAGPDILTEDCGRLYESSDIDELVAHLRWFANSRNNLDSMKRAARFRAEKFTWGRYRQTIQTATEKYI